MTAHFPLMVPGASADGTLDVQAPFDRSTIATVDVAGASAIEQALSTAHALFRDRDAWLPAPQRIAILECLGEIMQERAEELEWFQRWDKVLDDSNAPFYQWFVGGKTHIIHNDIDRHLKTYRKNFFSLCIYSNYRWFIKYNPLPPYINQGIRCPQVNTHII